MADYYSWAKRLLKEEKIPTRVICPIGILGTRARESSSLMKMGSCYGPQIIKEENILRAI